VTSFIFYFEGIRESDKFFFAFEEREMVFGCFGERDQLLFLFFLLRECVCVLESVIETHKFL